MPQHKHLHRRRLLAGSDDARRTIRSNTLTNRGPVAVDLSDFDAVGIVSDILVSLRAHTMPTSADTAATVSAPDGWHRVVMTARGERARRAGRALRAAQHLTAEERGRRAGRARLAARR